MNLSQDSNFTCWTKYRHYFAGPIIGYLLDRKYGLCSKLYTNFLPGIINTGFFSM